MRVLPRKLNQSGQAVLLVLLGMAAVLTLVLSVVSRSVSDISVTNRDEESSQAYSLAEKGIEALLLNPYAEVGGLAEEGISANAEAYAKGETSADFDPIKAGQSDTIWFVSHDQNGNLSCNGEGEICMWTFAPEICWGNPGTTAADAPAIEVSFYYDLTGQSVSDTPSYENMFVVRRAYSANTLSSDNFIDVSTNSCSLGNYEFSTGNILATSNAGDGLIPSDMDTTLCDASSGCILFARVKMIYNSDTEHGVGVKIVSANNSTLPQQGWKITSSGTSGEATRKVETIQYYPDPLDIFDNALSSFGMDADLAK